MDRLTPESVRDLRLSSGPGRHGASVSIVSDAIKLEEKILIAKITKVQCAIGNVNIRR